MFFPFLEKRKERECEPIWTKGVDTKNPVKCLLRNLVKKRIDKVRSFAGSRGNKCSFQDSENKVSVIVLIQIMVGIYPALLKSAVMYGVCFPTSSARRFVSD